MELPYRLICLDLDGTLLVSHHDMDQETTEVLREIENRGASIVIATGRPAFLAKDFAGAISEEAYFIGANGAVAGKVNQDELILNTPMKQETLEQLFEISEELGVVPLFYTAREMLILNTEFARRAIARNSWLKWVSQHHLHMINSKKEYEAYILRDDVIVTKANLCFPREGMTESAIQALEESQGFEIETFADICIEVVEKGMNKSLGIDALRKELHVDREQVIAFGDGENDREMLLSVGHSVAMGNAIPSIKEIANVVTDTNQNKGVAKELVKIFELNNK